MTIIKRGSILQVRLVFVFMLALLIALPSALYAQGDYMAPPVGNGSGNVPSDNASVFNWTEVPANQTVPIVRATFDEGGYQLYDNVGETIIVPFQNQNLYVMKFAISDNGSMYFVNSGDAPILYMPRHGYIDNATVPGARWYPFPPDFHPQSPVFIGIAPSWSAFIGMGWYHGMYFTGGYWGHSPFISGGLFVAIPGLFIAIGGEHYYGWGAYHHYYMYHPGWYHPGFYRRSWYSHSVMFHPGFHGVRGFHAAAHFGGGGFHGGGHVFRGAGHAYGGSHGSFGGGQRYGSFRGAGNSYGSSHGSFGGGHASGSFRGAGSSYGGSHGSFGGGQRYGSFRGAGNSYGSSHGSFGGGHGSFGGGSGHGGDSHGSFGGHGGGDHGGGSDRDHH